MGQIADNLDIEFRTQFRDGRNLYLVANRRRNQLYISLTHDMGKLGMGMDMSLDDLSDLQTMFAGLCMLTHMQLDPPTSYTRAASLMRSMSLTMLDTERAGKIEWAHHDGLTNIYLVDIKNQHTPDLTLRLDRTAPLMYMLMGLIYQQLHREPKEEELYE